jgi:hypothetical protein
VSFAQRGGERSIVRRVDLPSRERDLPTMPTKIGRSPHEPEMDLARALHERHEDSARGSRRGRDTRDRSRREQPAKGLAERIPRKNAAQRRLAHGQVT